MPYKSYQTPKRSTRGTRASAAAEVAELETPEVKEEVKTEEVIQETDAEMNEVSEKAGGEDETNGISQENGDGDDSTKKKPWQRIKDGGVRKLPKDVLKRRKNFRLKKLIVPKAPVMILHELVGSSTVQFDVTDPVPPHMPNMPMLFTAKTVYQDNEFLGKGPTKSIAKNICAEQVLQFITTQSCQSGNKTEKMETEATEEENGEEQTEANGDTKNANAFETETPWSSLASLAMFKLFNDWQAQGYHLPPELVRGSGMTIAERPAQVGPGGPGAGPIPVVGEKPAEKKQKPKKEKTDKGEKTLPEDYLKKHPVQLLNEMKGPLEYEETKREGEPPSLIFTMSVKVGEAAYSGVGKSKKDAKKAAAQAALLATYNITFQ